MKSFIKKLLREQLIESMPDELVGNVNISIPFNRLIIDKLNLEWAIRNVIEKRFSRSNDKPMQVAASQNGEYYLLDGYHRLVEAVLNGKTSTKGILLNKPYEELKKMNKIGVGCSGGSGDEFCNNFKTVGSIEMIKNSFNPQNKLKEQLIDGQEMNSAMETLCNKMTINSYEEAIIYVNGALKDMDEQSRHKVMKVIHTPLENLKHQQNQINGEIKKQNMSGDSMPDQADTYWHQIQSTLCEMGSDFQ